MQNNSFLPAGEKYLKNKVDLMSWSPTKDLLAISSKSGELFLYRFVGLERVWVLPVPEDGVEISSIKWRPDGKVIGVVYNNKKYGIQFVYMEKAKIIWKLKSKYKFNTILLWENLKDSKTSDKDKTKVDCRETICDDFNALTIKDYIPQLPKLTSENDLSGQDLLTITGDCGFHVLLASSENSVITWLAYGIYPIMEMDCSIIDPVNANTSFINACVSPCFRYLSVVTQNDKSQVLHTYKLNQLADNISIFDNMTNKVAHMQFTVLYLEEVLDCMRESCETALQETESKLTNLLKTNCETSSIGDDFMQLLMWGKPTETLKDLFGNRMNKKSIIKVGTTTEAVYSKVQQYIIVNIQIAINTLYYHLSEIKGIINDQTGPTVLPVNEEIVTETMKCAGTFLQKSNEMLQVIERSLQTFKSFFRWLYISMLRYLDEPVTNVPKMSQKDFSFVADFIYEHFFDDDDENVSSSQDSQFNVERVFQYLINEPLTCLMDTSGNDWFKFLDSTPSVQSSDLILTRDPKASLRQLFNKLNTNLTNLCFAESFPLLSSCEKLSTRNIFLPKQITNPLCNVWFQSTEEDSETATASKSFCVSFNNRELLDAVLFISVCMEQKDVNKLSMKSALLKFTSTEGEEIAQRRVIALKHYNDKYITMLLSQRENEQEQDRSPASWLTMVFTPTLLKLVEENGMDCSNAANEDDFLANLKQVDAFSCISHRRIMEARLKPTNISASGTREIACVLSEDCHCISAYEMDQREEESENSEEVDEMD